jgi:hypothetical protein
VLPSQFISARLKMCASMPAAPPVDDHPLDDDLAAADQIMVDDDLPDRGKTIICALTDGLNELWLPPSPFAADIGPEVVWRARLTWLEERLRVGDAPAMIKAMPAFSRRQRWVVQPLVVVFRRLLATPAAEARCGRIFGARRRAVFLEWVTRWPLPASGPLSVRYRQCACGRAC